MHRVMREVDIDVSHHVDEPEMEFVFSSARHDPHVVAVETRDKPVRAVLLVIDGYSAKNHRPHTNVVHMVRRQYDDECTLGNVNLGRYLGSFFQNGWRWYAFAPRATPVAAERRESGPAPAAPTNAGRAGPAVPAVQSGARGREALSQREPERAASRPYQGPNTPSDRRR